MKVMKVNNDTQLKDAFKIRVEVFVDEQNVPPEEELDEFEEVATHFVVYDDEDMPIGAGRIRFFEGFGKVERICIAKAYRSKGLGAILMEAIENEGQKQGYTSFKLNSQVQAIPFYEKRGYKVCSGEFLDAGIPHVTMKKN